MIKFKIEKTCYNEWEIYFIDYHGKCTISDNHKTRQSARDFLKEYKENIPKISEVLMKSADKYLSHPDISILYDLHDYSCNAVYDCLQQEYSDYVEYLWCEIVELLESMGLPVDSVSAFYEFTDNGYITPESQEVRYAWLYFAGLIALEECR